MNPALVKSAPSTLPEGPGSFALSAVSGFVDTAGFILLAGIFTSHVTGNLVLAGAALAGRFEGGVGVRLALLAVFMFAVAAASALSKWAEKRSRAAVSALLAAEAAMLGLFLLAGVALGESGRAFRDWELFLIAGTAVVAMGIQNALMREALKSWLPTTMMTGNTTQFTLDAFAPVLGVTGPEIRPRLLRTGTVLMGFLLGASLGALSAAFLRMWSPLIPMCAVMVLAYTALPRAPRPAKDHA